MVKYSTGLDSTMYVLLYGNQRKKIEFLKVRGFRKRDDRLRLSHSSSVFPPFSDSDLEGLGPKKGSIAALNELVEIDGEVWGKGVVLTWDEDKMQATESAFVNLKARIREYPPPQKRQPSTR
ncbi:unnamed protein product [Lactuca saligna]|uniref:Uncharacterized protein n=1 Tax=Lactuca saligna TaxID=75948 RepID=A0AA36EJX6_LACSI|nr:unnamed protein product [Lactuca saligna]